MPYNRKDFELLNKLRELEARRIQAAYKTASNELESLDEMTEKDLLKVIAAKLIMIEEKTKHFAFEFVKKKINKMG